MANVGNASGGDGGCVEEQFCNEEVGVEVEVAASQAERWSAIVGAQTCSVERMRLTVETIKRAAGKLVLARLMRRESQRRWISGGVANDVSA